MFRGRVSKFAEKTGDRFYQAFKENNTTEMEIFYRENFPKVARYIRANNGDLENAKDIFQEAFLTVWQNIKMNKINAETVISLEAYLYKISKNKWLDHLRSLESRKIIYVDEIVDTDSENENLHQKKELDELKYQKLEKGFKYLGKGCRILLEKFYFNKMSLREIAIEYNWTENTAKNNKYRCLQQLKKLALKNSEEL